MRRLIPLAVGALVTALGVFITLRGLGIGGSSASNRSPAWAILGPVIAGFGVALAYQGIRPPAPPRR